MGYIYRGLYHRHRDQLPAVLNADVTRVLKQAKHSFAKNCYTKLTPAKRCEFTSSQPSRAHCNSTIIIYFYQREQNLTQFVNVLLVKLS